MSNESLSSYVKKNYNEFIDTILYYYRMFDYNIDVNSLLKLPYNIFVDLILKQVNMKRKEVENENNALAEAQSNQKLKRTLKRPGHSYARR